ncbi:TetR/AcrR family transcriptional regulator [Cerasibacillus terrae]|uniref:TetR/AcrR family transcriptional regulator n=1 Tax=Cerasibacillus terrae TaxID=2498845 RepID=A0A5C8NVD7_9BACI|nr:TetR/AcrR family transcriptional regulator [Cerasibacillus terrae]TXL65109.1 TetR/AcrR family transcriptional regulator [Cerasibacillus terrae]
MDGFEKRKQQKKEDILNASLTLFKKYGVQRVSVTEIAKKANVSQVTIYNYFGSKNNLAHEVIIFYVDQVWEGYEQLFDSNAPFLDKIKQVIFDKTMEANHINQEFFEYFMKEYTDEGGNNYIEEMYTKKALPRFMDLFKEGREQGYINPNISNEAILLYIQIFKEYMQKGDVTKEILPFTEELTKLFFYGIAGKEKD